MDPRGQWLLGSKFNVTPASCQVSELLRLNSEC